MEQLQIIIVELEFIDGSKQYLNSFSKDTFINLEEWMKLNAFQEIMKVLAENTLSLENFSKLKSINFVNSVRNLK